MRNGKVRILCESAIMLALSSVLSLVKIWPMPWGGSVTLVSMLPVMLIAVKYGNKIGLGTAFTYSAIQIFIDLAAMMSWGMTPSIFIGSLAFDYLIAYSALGLAGLWRKHGTAGIIGGMSFAIIIRYISHILSGCIFFSEMRADAWFKDFPIVFYSMIYNGCYILPELIFTIIVAVILIRVPVTHKLITGENATVKQ